jgi:hypothetical protein
VLKLKSDNIHGIISIFIMAFFSSQTYSFVKIMPRPFVYIFILTYMVLLMNAKASEMYSLSGTSIKDKNGRVCNLDKTPVYTIESHDKSAIIISGRGYVLVSDLDSCRHGGTVHVHMIPDNVGILTDINISKGIYVAVDFVSTGPVLYLAIVARIGSSQNLVSLKGAYIQGEESSKLQEYAFSGSGEAGMSIISPDGNFVAPDGNIECREDSFPGVWDIKKNHRVIMTDNACTALFL